MARTGIGATLTLTGLTSGANAFTGRFKSISAPSFSVDALDDTALDATTFYQVVADDLAKSAPVTASYFCDLKAKQPTYGARYTATLTYPKQENTSVAATIIGSAIVTRVDFPESTPGALLMGSVELTFDGKTGPAFKEAS